MDHTGFLPNSLRSFTTGRGIANWGEKVKGDVDFVTRLQASISKLVLREHPPSLS